MHWPSPVATTAAAAAAAAALPALAAVRRRSEDVLVDVLRHGGHGGTLFIPLQVVEVLQCAPPPPQHNPEAVYV
jgi:hypothetical protein